MPALLVSEQCLQELAEHAVGEILPAPLWDPSELMVEQGGQLRRRHPGPQGSAVLAGWITRWSHNRAANTTQAYEAALSHYLSFCEQYQREWTDILALRDFLYGLAYPRIRYLQAVRTRRRKPMPRGQEPGVSWNTLAQHHAAIAKAWASEGRERPSAYTAWREWMEGIRRHLGAPVDQKSAVLVDDLRQAVSLIEAQKNPLVVARDRALLLLGWHGALRVSELANLAVEDVYQDLSGWVIHLSTSKTDQLHQGRNKPIWPSEDPSICPIRAYQEWISCSALGTGPLFRPFNKHGGLRRQALGTDSIRRILGAYISVRNWGAHSLRIGYVTQARLAGAATEEIMVVTQHKRREMVDHYAQQVDAHRQGPGALA